jgi:hypothetical protein
MQLITISNASFFSRITPFALTKQKDKIITYFYKYITFENFEKILKQTFDAHAHPVSKYKGRTEHSAKRIIFYTFLLLLFEEL